MAIIDWYGMNDMYSYCTVHLKSLKSRACACVQVEAERPPSRIAYCMYSILLQRINDPPSRPACLSVGTLHIIHLHLLLCLFHAILTCSVRDLQHFTLYMNTFASSLPFQSWKIFKIPRALPLNFIFHRRNVRSLLDVSSFFRSSTKNLEIM